MSDKDQSIITEEKQNDLKENKITEKWRKQKGKSIGKESIFILFIVILFLVDLLLVITVDFSVMDIVIGCDLCFSEKFSRSTLGIFLKILLVGAIIGRILILFESFFKKNNET